MQKYQRSIFGLNESDKFNSFGFVCYFFVFGLVEAPRLCLICGLQDERFGHIAIHARAATAPLHG